MFDRYPFLLKPRGCPPPGTRTFDRYPVLWKPKELRPGGKK